MKQHHFCLFTSSPKNWLCTGAASIEVGVLISINKWQKASFFCPNEQVLHDAKRSLAPTVASSSGKAEDSYQSEQFAQVSLRLVQISDADVEHYVVGYLPEAYLK